MKYATTQQFGGQRTSVGRVVVCKTGHGCQTGVISEINEDEPVIRVLSASTHPDVTTTREYYDARTEGDLDDAPDGSWSWPPRV